MKRLLAGLTALAALATTDAGAGESIRLTPGSVTLEGAVRTLVGSEPARVDLLRTRTLTAGTIAGSHEASLFGGPSLEFGGFVEYDADYRFDATVRQGIGSTTTGFGAGYGSAVGADTSYRVRLGTGVTEARSDSYFSLNPTTSATGDYDAEGRDVNLSLTLTHSFTPNLFLNGTAAARRTLGAGGDSQWTQGDNQFLLGAGLGYRF